MLRVSVNRSMVSRKPRHVQAGGLGKGDFKRQKLPMNGRISPAGRCNRTLPSCSLRASFCAGRVAWLVAVINADNQQDSRLLTDSRKSGPPVPVASKINSSEFSRECVERGIRAELFLYAATFEVINWLLDPANPGHNLCRPKNSPDSLTSCLEFQKFSVTITICHSLHDSV